jgi:hypothetical protein
VYPQGNPRRAALPGRRQGERSGNVGFPTKNLAIDANHLNAVNVRAELLWGAPRTLKLEDNLPAVKRVGMQARFDILKEDPPGEFLWLEAAASMDVAVSRARILGSRVQGRIIIFDQESQSTVPVSQVGSATA